MQWLHAQASVNSGVKQEDAFSIDKVNLYERLGFDTFVKLSTNFYTRVFEDDQTWFRTIFSNSTKEEAIRNQYEFCIQRMGGPPLYGQRRGHPSLIGRHSPYAMTKEAAGRWLYHMEAALDDTHEIDSDSKNRLFNFFKHTAFFLVAGKELTNNHRLVGYGGCKHRVGEA
ncbi:unnamed protein product [Sphagnum jensenii]|uniref:Hemoglobin n=1 Tax=Sphagnum jensenii TaxID=128206 RepID=A0ABP0WAZ1_9BRYO